MDQRTYPRLLFASDLHGKAEAFERFAALLKEPRYALGVLGGDLHDEWLPDELVRKLTGCSGDDLLEEIGSDQDDGVQLWNQSRSRSLQDTAIGLRIGGFADLLKSTGKPVLYVLGNHDRIPWPEGEGLVDLHLKRVELLGWNFVGYRWTDLDRSEEELTLDLQTLNGLIDDKTILVSHSPAKGVLDGLVEWGTGYGIEVLNRLETKPRLHLVGHVHSQAGRKGNTINGCWPTRRAFFEVDLQSKRSKVRG